MLKRFQFLSAIVLFTFLWITIRFPYQVKETIGRFVSDKNRVDPASLHLHGEFVETNLGTAQEHDGSVTVRMIAQRYVFVPQCMLLPAGVSVHFRITSSDVTHELTASGTDFHIKVVPGAVTEAHMRFTRTGEYSMPCHEFCGPGHFDMRARLLVVDRDQFPISPDKRASCTIPKVQTPSNVVWNETTIAMASGGEPLRGLLIAKRCDHCHGSEGFSSNPATPNLASMDRLTIWKQLEDFRSGKRPSPVMQAVVSALSSKDFADLAAYYSMLPNYPDPFDSRAFPQPAPASTKVAVAARLVTLGDGQRGIPPCSACHGRVGYILAAGSLTTQNNVYLQNQLQGFASGIRANDVDMPMRSIARQLTENERQALADYYGAAFGTAPAGTHHWP